jgi:hypothetical protein
LKYSKLGTQLHHSKAIFTIKRASVVSVRKLTIVRQKKPRRSPSTSGAKLDKNRVRPYFRDVKKTLTREIKPPAETHAHARISLPWPLRAPGKEGPHL